MDMRIGPETANHDRFAFKRLDRFKLRPGNQHNRKGRHVAGNDLDRDTRNRCGDHGGNTRMIINSSIEKGRQRRRTPYLNELGFDTFFSKESFLLRQRQSDKMTKWCRVSYSDLICCVDRGLEEQK